LAGGLTSTKLMMLGDAIAVHSGSVMTSFFFLIKNIHFYYTNIKNLNTTQKTLISEENYSDDLC
jgi:thymidylate synthase